MTELDPDPSFYSMTSITQIRHGIWVNICNLLIGMAYSFPVVRLPELSKPDSLISMTATEKSWIEDIVLIFLPIGSDISGLMLDYLGRRVTLVISQAFCIIGWMYTASATTAFKMITGLAITAFGCGMSMEIPRLYTSEMSLVNMRGSLAALSNVFIYLGMVLQIALVTVIPWQRLCYLCCLLTISLFTSYLLLGESPSYLLTVDVYEAVKALYSFRSSNSYNIKKEQNRLIEFKQDNDIRSLNMYEKLRLMCSRNVRISYGIVTMYLIFGCLSGVPMVTIWTGEVLELCHSSVDADLGHLIIASTGLLVSLMGTVLLYRYDRKKIALTTVCGVSITSFLMGFFLLTDTGPFIVPQILLMAYVAFACLGFQCLPFLLMTEIYPSQIRGMLMCNSLTIYNVMVWLSIKSFPYMYENVGISWTFFIFGIASLLAAMFLYKLMPETKTLTLQELEEYFRGTRPALISDRAAAASLSRGSRTATTPKVAAVLAKMESNQATPTTAFVEVTPSSTSVLSKKSVSLQIGSKIFEKRDDDAS